MPSYRRFEDLPVWQEAARLYEAVDRFLASAGRRLTRSFRDQLERAALSVSNNIAGSQTAELARCAQSCARQLQSPASQSVICHLQSVM